MTPSRFRGSLLLLPPVPPLPPGAQSRTTGLRAECLGVPPPTPPPVQTPEALSGPCLPPPRPFNPPTAPQKRGGTQRNTDSPPPRCSRPVRPPRCPPPLPPRQAALAAPGALSGSGGGSGERRECCREL